MSAIAAKEGENMNPTFQDGETTALPSMGLNSIRPTRQGQLATAANRPTFACRGRRSMTLLGPGTSTVTCRSISPPSHGVSSQGS